MSHARLILSMVAALLMLLLPGRLAPVAYAQADAAARERLVRAAFVYNFAQFVEWPAGAFAAEDAPIVVGLIGEAPLNAAVEQTVAGKTVGKHPFAIRHFDGPGALAAATGVHLVVVHAGVPDEVLRGIPAGRHVLTVGESDGFLRAGGMIRLFTQANKVRFEIAPKAAERAGLRVGAKLLKLAQVYEE